MSTQTSGLAAARLAATAAATAGDSGTLYHLVSGLLDEGVPFETVLFDLLTPTEKEVGTRWQDGDTLVAEEHAATATIETVVSLLAGSFDRPSNGDYVVVAAAEGDHHSLPGRLVAAHLLYLGYRTTYLGANVLAADLREYLEVEPPSALILSCAMTNHLVGARAGIRSAHSVGSPVLAGGHGFGPDGAWAPMAGADAWVADLSDVPTVLGTWEPDPARAENDANDPSGELIELIHNRASVVAGAQAHLTARSVDVDARILDEISLLLGVLEAALFVGDEQPLTQMLAWQETTLLAHGLLRASVIAEAVKAAVADVSPHAGAVLSRAIASG